jgi:hypothetical protein
MEYDKHKRTKHGFGIGYQCPPCQQLFMRKNYFTSHFLRRHVELVKPGVDPIPNLTSINRDEEYIPFLKKTPVGKYKPTPISSKLQQHVLIRREKKPKNRYNPKDVAVIPSIKDSKVNYMITPWPKSGK